ncbi:MAG: phenylacetic acid degradation protein PaaD [Thermus sp.]|uniref:hydroxyphenylacetyl-CoA thioesterase PaaI n=1 Tax=Thermus sp. TaxID=275 RepID=UPI003322798E
MKDPFMETLGLQTLSLGAGEAVVEGVVREPHLNLHGTGHGGFLYALADSAFALASNSRGPAVGLSTRMDFFRPVRPGERVRAVAREVFLSRRTATYQVELLRLGEEQERVALFIGTVYRMEVKDVPTGTRDPA